MRVSIVGAGYVGLVTGACLADKGHDVRCIDVDRARVDQINAGVPPIHEEGLPELLTRVVGDRLEATTDLAAAVDWSDLTMVAVGTPLGTDATIDLRFVSAAATQIGETLRTRDPDRYHVTVVKSTVVPGTTVDVVVPALEAASGRTAGEGFGVGVNPEFLTEGTAVRDFTDPDRIVIGGIDQRSVETIERLYTAFDDAPRVRTNPSTAELIKYTSNALLAAMISFSNEIGNLAVALGDVDVADVMAGVHPSIYLSPRLSDGRRVEAPITSFLEAGCGFGGSCLPKDVGALIAHGERAGTPMRMLRAVLDINAGQPERLVALVRDGLDGLDGRRVTVLGLAFKPDTDDLRESPAFPVIDELLAGGATVTAHDPVAIPAASARLPDRVHLVDDLADAMADADAVVIVTRWEQYTDVPKIIADRDPQPLVVDGRRLLPRYATPRYAGIGLGDFAERASV